MRTFRSFRSTRSTGTTRSSRSSRALALSTASVAGAAVLVASGYAQAAEPAPTPAPAAPSSSTTTQLAPDGPVRVEHQVGKVLEGTAVLGDGTPVMTTIYENSMHGSSVQVVLGDPDDENIGYVEQAGPFFQAGVIDVTVDVNGTPVRFQGTATETGKPTKIVEPIQDGGEQIVTRGTNTPLATDITVTAGSASAAVEFAPAFAFDLVSRKVTLYGR